MRTLGRFTCVLGLIAIGAACGGGAVAQAQNPAFTPFNTFIRQVAATKLESMAAAPGAKVKDAAEFERMRKHVLTLYQGVSVAHSFVDDGQTFDCVPLNQQPSLRIFGQKTIAAPPPSPPDGSDDALAPGGQAVERADQSDMANRLDAFGNPTTCETGTFPMRRVTLEEIARFGTLREFFRKGPGDAGQFKKSEGIGAAIPHKYAHAYQFATNYGGTSELNIWSPHIDQSKGEMMSLSQHWYVNYKGSLTQTAEGGWQNLPMKYGVNKSVLFIYWTADGYNATGCYNMDCAGFVQYSSKLALGKGFSHYSTSGGTQYEFKLTYQLFKGAWWLGVNGTWMGYYPASIYGAGKLRQYAAEVDYGGETVGSPTYPPMGSGQFAAAGYRKAAYQRLIKLITNGATGASRAVTLSPDQRSPSCYKISVHNHSTGGWGSYFFFGGPGGNAC